MKNKIKILLLVFVLALTFVANVNAQTTIKEDASLYDYEKYIYIIGSSKFSGITVTGGMATVAGAREAYIQYYINNNWEFNPEDVKIYMYSPNSEKWSILPRNTEEQFKDLTEEEVEKFTENLNIYYTNNEEKILEVPYEVELKKGYELGFETGNPTKNEEIDYKDGKLLIPATVQSVQTYMVNENEEYIELDYLERNEDSTFEIFTTAVNTLAELKQAIADEKYEIRLNADIVDIDETLTIPYDVYFNGAGHKLAFKDIERDATSDVASGLVIAGDNSNVFDLTIEMDAKEGWQGNYGLQVYGAKEVYISNYTGTKADAALLVNGSEVYLNGEIDVTGNEFGGIEVSKGSNPELLNSKLYAYGNITMEDEAIDKPIIWVENGLGYVYSSLIPNEIVPSTAGKTQTFYYSSEEMYTSIGVSNVGELISAMQLPFIQKIKLLKDIDLPTALEVDRMITIELNNCKLTVKEDTEGNGVFHVIEGGDLTINGDGIVDGAGKNKWNIVVFADGGYVTINGGTYTNKNLTVLPEDTDSDHFDVIYAKGSGIVVINGGRFEGKTPAWLLNLHDGSRGTASIMVNGGTFVGFNPANNAAEGEGTSFLGWERKVTIINNEYTVSEINENDVALSLANGVAYQDLQTAVNEAERDIRLLKDIELETAIKVDRRASIDLNNCNLTMPNDTAGDGVFHVVKGGDLTIYGDGIVDGVGNNKWNMAIFADGGNVNIYGGTYTNTNLTILDEDTDSSHFDLIYAKGESQVNIYGGRFEGKTPAWLLNLHDGSRETASIAVHGGTFVGLNPGASLAEGEGTDFLAYGYKVVLKDNEYIVIGAEVTDNFLVNGMTFKGTLQEAVNAVEAGTTIKLLQSIDLPTGGLKVAKKVTIDLNNCNLTVTEDTAGDGVFHVVEGGDLTINGEGVVDGAGKNKWNIVVFADGGHVTINGGTYTNANLTILDEDTDADHFDVIYAKGKGSVVINGGTFAGYTPAWLLNLHDGSRGTASIEVYGGIFVGFNPADNKAEGEETNFVANGYKSTGNGYNEFYVEKAN